MGVKVCFILLFRVEGLAVGGRKQQQGLLPLPLPLPPSPPTPAPRPLPQVQDPAEARPFLPQLMPLLDRVANEAADPELREVGR